MSHRVAAAAILAAGIRCSLACAAFEHSATGPRDLSLGKATIAASADGWAPFVNPGRLAACSLANAVFYHIPGLFGLPELSSSGGGFSFPCQGLGIALSCGWFGSDQYRESNMALGIGGTVYSGLGMGIRMHMNRLSIGGYGSSTVFTIDVGIVLECSENLAIGGTATNVAAATLGRAGESLPQALDAGIWYSPIPAVHLALSTGKEMLFAPEFRCGIEIDAADCLSLRAGFTDTPSTVSAGCAFRLPDFSAEYGFAHHWVLGATHEIGIALHFR